MSKKPRTSGKDTTKQPPSSRKKTNHTLHAQWNYKAQNSDEITFEKGQLVTFIRQDRDNDGWIVVKTQDGTVGLVPGRHFTLVKDNGSSSDDYPAPANKRQHVIMEMIKTEKRYNKTLRVLISDYKEPLEAGHEILPKYEADLLFKQLPTLLNLSDVLLADLKKAKYKDIGTVFINFAPYLKSYAPFLINYRDAMKFLQAIKEGKSRRSKWLAFLAKKQTNFESLLIQPAQRIPRYELLLKELDKRTEDSHPEKADIQKAIAGVHESAAKNDLSLGDQDLQWQKDSKSTQKLEKEPTHHSQVQSCKRLPFSKPRPPPVPPPKPDEEAAGPEDTVATSRLLIDAARKGDGANLRLRVPGIGWVPLKTAQLRDFLRQPPRNFFCKRTLDKWIFDAQKQWDVGVLRDEDTDATEPADAAPPPVPPHATGHTPAQPTPPTPPPHKNRKRAPRKTKPKALLRGAIAAAMAKSSSGPPPLPTPPPFPDPLPPPLPTPPPFSPTPPPPPPKSHS